MDAWEELCPVAKERGRWEGTHGSFVDNWPQRRKIEKIWWQINDYLEISEW